MPLTSRIPDFNRTELDLEDFARAAEFSDGPIQKVLAFLLGRDKANAIWRLLSLDPFGRLFTVQGVVNPVFKVGNQLVIAGGGTTASVQQNSARQELYLQNVGKVPVFINFTGSASGNDLMLPNDSALRITGYQGTITIQNQAAGNALINVLEA